MTDGPLILMATLVFAGTMLFGIGITLTAGREVSRGRTAPMRRLSALGYGLMCAGSLVLCFVLVLAG